MRDHGGNIDQARAAYGGADWIDLSTGINRVPYPLPALSPEAWTMLPTAEAKAGLIAAARAAFGTEAPGVALAGAQAAIQLLPRLLGPGRARVLGPPITNMPRACGRAVGRSRRWTRSKVSRAPISPWW